MGYRTLKKEEVEKMPYSLSKEVVQSPCVKDEEFIDDVEYNQRWWGWYCEENNLDVNTGKSFESIFMYIRPIF